jgi:hypothetical protein
MHFCSLCWFKLPVIRCWLIAGLFFLVCPAARAQLSSFGNTGFESSLTNWTTSVPSGTTATLAVTTGKAGSSPGSGSTIHAGTHAFQANVTKAGSGPNYPTLTHTAFTANSTGTYEVSFFAWSGGNQSVNRPVMVLHISGGGPAYSVTFQPSSVGWDEFHFCFQASGSTTISFTFQQKATFNIDDVLVYDQTDAVVDTATQYLHQWGMQPTASSTNATTQATCWTGGDNNITAQLPDGRVAWFFNDSFTGPIDYTTNYRNVNGMNFVRNYYSVQSVAPEASATLTPMITDGTTTFFLPSTADQTNQSAIFWEQDAITEGSNIQVILVEPSDGGSGSVIRNQIATLSAPNYNSPTYTYLNWGSITLNGGDGYIYIYDTDGGSGRSVARVPYGGLTPRSGHFRSIVPLVG